MIASKQKGFTLLEISVVMIIIVILASAVMPNLLNRPQQAKQIVVTSELQSISLAITLFEIDFGHLPDQLLHLSHPDTIDADLKNKKPYLSHLPKDPWGNPYHYEIINDYHFRVCSLGADHKIGGDGIASDKCYP